MNINILGMSELKWTGMGKFNSDYEGCFISYKKLLSTTVDKNFLDEMK